MTTMVCVFCGARDGHDSIYREAARAFGETLARRGFGLVYGGGKVGLMGVVADAVLAAGGRVVGVIPGFLTHAEVLHAGLSEQVLVDDLFERKAVMIERADAFVALPGGIGTFDELLEVIAWRQLGQLQHPIGLLNVNGFFDPWLSLFNHWVKCGFASPHDITHLIIDSDGERLADHLQRPAAT